MSDMKLIMENWRNFQLNEISGNDPVTYGLLKSILKLMTGIKQGLTGDALAAASGILGVVDSGIAKDITKAIDFKGTFIDPQTFEPLYSDSQIEDIRNILRLNISSVINCIKINDNSLIYLDATLREWAGYIKFADHFLGCDSVGQHLAKSVGQKATVVIGGTFPKNVSYPDDADFTIFDLGKDRRIYDPIRITIDNHVSEVNRGIMKMEDKTLDNIIQNIERLT